MNIAFSGVCECVCVCVCVSVCVFPTETETIEKNIEKCR